jgi:hypothetical protein
LELCLHNVIWNAKRERRFVPNRPENFVGSTVSESEKVGNLNAGHYASGSSALEILFLPSKLRFMELRFWCFTVCVSTNTNSVSIENISGEAKQSQSWVLGWMWSCGFRCGEYRDYMLGLYSFDRGLKQGLLHESYGVRN